MDSGAEERPEPTRQERRAERKEKERQRVKKHGKGFIRSYTDAIMKRLKQKGG
jgi:hypothetical protein